MDYIYKKSGPIFNAHSYWTKQPIEVVKQYIEKYTSVGDTILDPFCGTGMTGVSSIITNRNFLLSDISHICLHIAKGYCTEYNQEDIEKKLENLFDGLEVYYQTICPNCGKLAHIKYEVLKDCLEEKSSLDIDHICFFCTCNNLSQIKQASKEDYDILNSEEYKKLYYPQYSFFGQEPKRNYKRGIFKVYQLYSKRNMSVLSILWQRINNIDDSNFKQLCKFAFTSILFNCSLLSRYSQRYKNTKVKMGTYYIPELIKDNNVLDSFKRKINTILKANSEIFKHSLSNKKIEGKIYLDDATKLACVNDCSIDYIYTDPPYSDMISYAELNLVYESWLQQFTDIRKEMIVSKAESKTLIDYKNMFESFMHNAFRVLKEDKYITIIFHNAKLPDWKAFQSAINIDGFLPVYTDEPERLISQSKTSSQHATGKNSQCFMAFTMQKKSNSKKNLIKLDKTKYSSLIDQLKKEAIKNGYTSKSDIFDYVINKIIFRYEIIDDIAI